MKYNTKRVEWEDHVDIIRYTLPIHIQDEKKASHKGKKRLRYDEMTDEQKKKSDGRRIKYYERRVKYLLNICKLNHLNLFVTLTSRDELEDYGEACRRWDRFIKRMKYRYGKDVRYIATHEKQKNRGNSGVWHFHALFNMDWIDFEELTDCWGHGFVFVKHICDDNGFWYVMKYISKEIMDDAASGVRNKDKKIYCSRNLQKPNITKVLEEDSVDDIIFDNQEDIIDSYSYPVKNHLGIQINQADCVKVRKERLYR